MRKFRGIMRYVSCREWDVHEYLWETIQLSMWSKVFDRGHGPVSCSKTRVGHPALTSQNLPVWTEIQDLRKHFGAFMHLFRMPNMFWGSSRLLATYLCYPTRTSAAFIFIAICRISDTIGPCESQERWEWTLPWSKGTLDEFPCLVRDSRKCFSWKDIRGPCRW